MRWLCTISAVLERDADPAEEAAFALARDILRAPGLVVVTTPTRGEAPKRAAPRGGACSHTMRLDRSDGVRETWTCTRCPRIEIRRAGAARRGTMKNDDTQRLAADAARSVRAFARAILHGDEAHRRWLLEAAEAFVAGDVMPSCASAAQGGNDDDPQP